MKVFIFISLFLGFLLLFYEMRLLEQVSDLAKRAQTGMEASARIRALEGRRRLFSLQEKHTIFTFVEGQLKYSGIRGRFPRLTVEWWIAGNLVVLSSVFMLFAALGEPAGGIWGCMLIGGVETMVLQRGRTRNLQRVNENMMKLLDFLENYSITAGELTGVLGQVSRYMEEPVRSALETCYLEAKTTGDTGSALLSMADCIEHPKFKELARNMEISVRYSADFSAMVRSTRRSLREYLRVLQERRGMLREALINMLLLLGMSLAVLAVVGGLIEVSVWQILLTTLPGQIALAVILLILLLFAAQVRKIQM